MRRPHAVLGRVALLACVLGCDFVGSPARAQVSGPPAGTVPVPPVPPRIAQGQDYERCLAMLSYDVAGANAFADAWEATGGGEGAMHCHALAQIAIGHGEIGAEMLEKLAGASKAPPLARASLSSQAVQAWLMGDDAARAYGDATLALALSPDDPDLLIDRSIAAATMERYMDAIEDLNRALKLDPRRTDAWVLRAAAWRHENRLDRAQQDIDRAIALSPENPDGLLERGILRERHGDRAGARADWEQVISLAPGSASADLAEQNLALLDAGPGRR